MHHKSEAHPCKCKQQAQWPLTLISEVCQCTCTHHSTCIHCIASFFGLSRKRNNCCKHFADHSCLKKPNHVHRDHAAKDARGRQRVKLASQLHERSYGPDTCAPAVTQRSSQYTIKRFPSKRQTETNPTTPPRTAEVVSILVWCFAAM